jgi:preprotein translocase subunit SecE
MRKQKKKLKTLDKTDKGMMNKVYFICFVSFLIGSIVFNNYYSDIALLYRVIGSLVFILLGSFCFFKTALGRKSIVLFKETKSELKKSTWPSRVETIQTAGMVFFFVVLVGVFLWIIDAIFLFVINSILI